MSDPADPGDSRDHLDRIVVADEQNLPVDVPALVALAGHAIAELGIEDGAELSIVLATPERMAGLKGQYLGEEVPTDVLAFPMDGAEVPGQGPQMLGDVVLCPAVAQRQAAGAGHSAADELHLLLVHGILHLLGYDHAKDDESAIMRAEERRILGSFAGAAR